MNQVTFQKYLKCQHCASLIHLVAKHSDHTPKNRYQSTCFTWLAGTECLCYTRSQPYSEEITWDVCKMRKMGFTSEVGKVKMVIAVKEHAANVTLKQMH